ncbi:MAG: DNA-binding domain-containing protein [Polyangiaceae bacterium]
MARMLLRRHDLAKDAEAVAIANRWLTGNDRLSPVEQLEIYREQFWLRHTQALIEDFPGVGGIIGQRDWERLSEGYLGAQPPTSFTLRDLGQHFAEFAAQCSWLEQRALVTDMARLEWAYVELFDAADPAPLSPDELAACGEDALAEARLVLSPGVRLLRVGYPVVELRKKILERSEQDIPLPSAAPENLVIYRSDLAIMHQTPGLEAFTLLDELARGQSLGQACESACAVGPEATARVAAHVGEWLASWVQLKWIIGVQG